MNPRDVYKGRSPNPGLADRATYAEDAAFQTLFGAGARRGSAPPRIDVVFRTKAPDTAHGDSEIREHGDNTVETGHEAPREPPVAVLDARADSRSGLPGRFEALVAPLAPQEFLDTCYAEKRPMLFRGKEGRFEALIDWDTLSTLMSTGLLEPRMRLFVDGKPIPTANCRAPRFGHGWRSDHYPRGHALDERRLMTMLRQGTTLILNEIQEYHPPIGEMADDLEETLGGYAHVNLYASWQATRGFATHWDDHDVFVLQVAGRKCWRLFGEARRFPMKWDTAGNVEAPARLVWNGVLSSGDVLYIPRGWWHDARTEPDEGEQGMGSLHLTCSVDPITGLDVLEWLKCELAGKEVFRRDLPIWPNAKEHDRRFAELRNLVVQALDGAFAQRLRTHLRSRWSERPSPRFDDYIEPWKSPDWGDCEISLRGNRLAAIGHDEDGTTIIVETEGYIWRFDRICLELLRPLVEAGRMKMSEYQRIAPERFSPAFVNGFAKLLIEEGVADARLPRR